jgi:microcystin-dependent protein
MADKRRNLGIPSGVVFPFAGTTAPYGYLVCDGSAISRSEYPALFVSLGSGTLHGVGDGLTTFNLPDYRGKFMRGLDGVAGNDPDKTTRTHPKTGAVVGNVVGSVQDHQTNAHTHFSVANQGQINDTAVNTSFAIADNGLQGGGNYAYNLGSGSTVANASPTNSSGGNETRPKNVNVNYIVKV